MSLEMLEKPLNNVLTKPENHFTVDLVNYNLNNKTSQNRRAS